MYHKSEIIIFITIILIAKDKVGKISTRSTSNLNLRVTIRARFNTGLSLGLGLEQRRGLELYLG